MNTASLSLSLRSSVSPLRGEHCETLESRLFLSASNVLSGPDRAAIQTAFSAGTLEHIISQVAVLNSPTLAVRNYATAVMLNQQADNYALENLATTYGRAIPSGVTSRADIAAARNMVSGVNTSTFDSAYLSAMEKISATMIANDGMLINATRNNAVLGYVEKVLSDELANLEGAKTLLTGTGTTAFTNTDTAYLQTTFSGSNLEIEISQLAQPATASTAVSDYASMLISMHTMVDSQVGSLAAAEGTTLTPGVSSRADLQTLKGVTVASRFPAKLDSAYLMASARSHALALGENARELISTDNASVIGFVESYMPMVIQHEEEAKALLGFAPVVLTNIAFAPTGATLSTADAAILSADISSRSLQLALSEIDQLAPGATASLATSATKDNTAATYRLENIANRYGISLPAGITSAGDLAAAGSLLTTLNIASARQAYESTMVSLNAALVSAEGSDITLTPNADIRTAVEQSLPNDVKHLELARRLQVGRGTGALTASDQAALQSTLSGSTLEIELARTDEANDPNVADVAFSKMLIRMHTVVNKQLVSLAARNHVTLTAGVTTPADIATANLVNAAIGTASFSTVYLTALATSHASALAAQAATLATTTNAGVIRFTEGYIPAVIMHLEEAESLLTGMPTAKAMMS